MFCFSKCDVCDNQVTEQARSSIEGRMKEAEEQRCTLEEKLLQAEKEKQDLEEQKKSVLAALEEQVRDPCYNQAQVKNVNTFTCFYDMKNFCFVCLC